MTGRSFKHGVCTGWPLGVGYVRGMRSFTVYGDGMLGPATFVESGYRWKARGSRAYCNNPFQGVSLQLDGPPGVKPLVWHKRDEICDDDDHSCGLWAYHDGSHYTRSPNTCSGIIWGYGKTTIGTKGFRCSKADVKAIVARDRVVVAGLCVAVCVFMVLGLVAIGEWQVDWVSGNAATVACSGLGAVLSAWGVFWATARQYLLIVDVGRMRRMRRRYAAEGVSVYSTARRMKKDWPVDKQINDQQVERQGRRRVT